MKKWVAVAVLAMTFAGSACGGDDDDGGTCTVSGTPATYMNECRTAYEERRRGCGALSKSNAYCEQSANAEMIDCARCFGCTWAVHEFQCQQTCTSSYIECSEQSSTCDAHYADCQVACDTAKDGQWYYGYCVLPDGVQW